MSILLILYSFINVVSIAGLSIVIRSLVTGKEQVTSKKWYKEPLIILPFSFLLFAFVGIINSSVNINVIQKATFLNIFLLVISIISFIFSISTIILVTRKREK